MEELATQANNKIKEWAKGREKLVVAIDGYTGVGKTTLLENLVKINSEILPVHMDDFMMTNPESFYLEQYDLDALRKKVESFEKGVLVIDGVFMAHEKVKNLWDKIIYLDGIEEEIDKRRVAREKARWGEKYFPETHPDSYFRKAIIALKKYRKEYKPEQMADLVLFNHAN
jgi:uridine kinase